MLAKSEMPWASPTGGVGGRGNCEKSEVGWWKIFTGRNSAKEVQREQGVIIFGRIINFFK